MNVTWFLEHDWNDPTYPAFVKAIEGQGYNIIKASQFENCYELFNKEDCYIYYGTLNFAAEVRRKAKWIPGTYYHPTDYDCINYYPKLGKYLLNSDYIMLPWGDVRRKKDFLYATLAEDDTIFLRPNSGLKLFTGKLIYKELFDNDLNILGYKDPEPHDLVIAARPRMVMNEWRFVCVNKKIITGSQYRFRQQSLLKENDDQNALNLAEEIAQQDYQPAPVWIIDICQTEAGNYYLLEVGCFSCAGLYRCNLEKIVREVSKAALDEWHQYNEYSPA